MSPRIYLGPEQWVLMSQIPGRARGTRDLAGTIALARAAGQVGVASFPVSYEHLSGVWNTLDGRGRQMLSITIDQVSRGVEIAPGTGAVINEVTGLLGGNGGGGNVGRKRLIGDLARAVSVESKMRRASPGTLPESSLIAAAVAHCDVVVVDSRWASALGDSEMGDRVDTKFLTSLDDLAPYLVGL